MKQRPHPIKRAFHVGLFARINLSIIILVIVVLIIICSLLTYSLIYPGIQKDRLLNAEAMNKLTTLMSQKYTSAFSQSKLMHNSDHIATRFVEFYWSNKQVIPLEDIRYINNYLTALRYADEDLLDAVIIPIKSSNRFSSTSDAGRRINPLYSYLDLPEIASFLASSESISIFYSAEQPYVYNDSKQVISFVIKLFNPINIAKKEVVAIVLINYPVDVFYQAYHELGALSGGSVYIVNKQSEIVFTTNTSLIGTSYNRSIEENSEVTKSSISTSGMQSINVIPKDRLHSTTNKMIATLLYILVPAMCLMTILIYFFNHQYQKRIDDLVKMMQRFSEDGIYSTIPIYHNDELGKLALQFNEMCEKLDLQIKMHYKAEVGRRTAELNALQAQINPHFLYNTIESIRMCAIENNDFIVSDMLIQLGRLFHWMIQLDKQIVYLEDEIEYNESYLSLQSLRYQDSFQSHFHVEAEALYFGIPKFTLQPIIENALKHGLYDNGMAGKIDVHVYTQDSLLILKVCDNGCGMAPNTLIQLQHHITDAIADLQYGIGMKNVHSRVQMLFGSKYGINIESTPNLGTTVTITLPAIAKKEMELQIELDYRKDEHKNEP